MASRLRNLQVAWLLPALVLASASVAVFWSAWERRHVNQELDQMYRVHVASVSRLIREGARQAAASIDLIYALSEQSIDNAVQRLSCLDPTAQEYGKELDAAGLSVLVTESEKDGFGGYWGPVAEPGREALTRQILQAEPGEIVETDYLRALGLYCAYFELEKPAIITTKLSKAGGDRTRWAIACQKADDLLELRKAIGVGPLLREVARRGVVYAAIQDKSGVLASSSRIALSSWSADPELQRALDMNTDDAISFRLLEAPDTPNEDEQDMGSRSIDRAVYEVFEGLGRFAMPDGTFALLRVGVDASYLVTARSELDRRHRVLWILAGSVFLLSVVGAMLLRRWDLRRVRAERQLAAREQESRWLQAVAQMAATVAHEVRSPLNTIKMIAQRLDLEFKRTDTSQKEYDDLIGLLSDEADRVDNVVGEFVQLGRPVELSPDTLPCGQALEQALMPLRLRVAKEGKRLEVDTPPNDLVRLDIRRFGQIVNNLVSNALDAVSQTGTVRIAARCDSDGLRLVVQDDGPGMDAEQVAQALRPFVTSKAKGTGLGLPLAMRLAEAHGGTLTLSSQPGRGTRAELFIPRAFG